MNSGNQEKWGSGYHPFPEMSRFLNSNSRIHYQTIKNPSVTRPTYSFLGYVCSIADNTEHIEEILLIFGEKYRSLIRTIIEEDCSNNDNKRNKRMTKNINRNPIPSILFHNPHRLSNLQPMNDKF